MLDPSNPQQVNGYSYANNSPVTCSDPSGNYLRDPNGGPLQGPGSTGSSVTPAPAGNSTTHKTNQTKSTAFDPWIGFKMEFADDWDFLQGFGGAAASTAKAVWVNAPLNYIIQAVNPWQGPAEAWASLNAHLQGQAQAVLAFAHDPGGTFISALGGAVDAKDWAAHPAKSGGTAAFSVVLAALCVTGVGESGVAGEGEATVAEAATATDTVVGEDVAAIDGPSGALSVTDHAAERMSQRGITSSQVEATVNGQQGFTYTLDGVVRTGYYDPTSRIFVGTVECSPSLVTLSGDTLRT